VHPNETPPVEPDVTTDLAARRADVLRRLLDRGVPPRTLETLLPGWEPFLTAALLPPADRT
jgi:hypothetical protein